MLAKDLATDAQAKLTVDKIDLPPLHPDTMLTKEHNLVLDLDETLIHTKLTAPTESDLVLFKIVRFTDSEGTHTYHSAVRPHLDYFLKEMSRIYNIIIYTASQEEYAVAHLTELGIAPYVKRLYHRKHCKPTKTKVSQKDLTSLKLDLSKTVFIDDSQIQINHAKENSILIKPFYGAKSDNELYRLIDFLKETTKEADLRPVSKKLKTYRENLIQSVIDRMTGSVAQLSVKEDYQQKSSSDQIPAK